jgi:hypothetical protein
MASPLSFKKNLKKRAQKGNSRTQSDYWTIALICQKNIKYENLNSKYENRTDLGLTACIHNIIILHESEPYYNIHFIITRFGPRRFQKIT